MWNYERLRIAKTILIKEQELESTSRFQELLYKTTINRYKLLRRIDTEVKEEVVKIIFNVYVSLIFDRV